METIEALIHRRSCRKYSDRPVEAEKLARIIEAGQYAPSGMGRQPVTFVAVTDPATVERLSQLNAQVMGREGDPFYGAKTVVVALVDRSVPTHLEDGSLAMGNLLNAAYALGVDSCWIHRAHEVFDSPEGLELLTKWGLPADGSLPARCGQLHSGLCRGHASRSKAAPRQRGVCSAVLTNGGPVDAARAALTPI